MSDEDRDLTDHQKVNILWEWRLQMLALVPAMRVLQIVLGLIIAGAAVWAILTGTIRP